MKEDYNRVADFMLQWSHDFSVMEMDLPGLFGMIEVVASMGPRLFSRGNGTPQSFSDMFFQELQWGHDLSAMEMYGKAEYLLNRTVRFNGATTFQPWKSRRRGGRRDGPAHASMGP